MDEEEVVVEDIVDCHAATLRAGEMGRLRLANELGLETTRGIERLEWVLWVGERTREGVGECWADADVDMDMEDVWSVAIDKWEGNGDNGIGPRGGGGYG